MLEAHLSVGIQKKGGNKDLYNNILNKKLHLLTCSKIRTHGPKKIFDYPLVKK